MEARATLKGTSVSKTFVAAVLVLVAMGLGAMGGYLVKGQGASASPVGGASHVQAQAVIDRPELPAPAAHAQGVIDRPELTAPAAQDNQIRGTRGNHGELE